MDYEGLSEADWLGRLVMMGTAYRKRFGRSIPITAELGELYACAKLGLQRASEHKTGYDALDRENKRVQIKTRAPSARSKSTGVDKSGRIGRFHNLNFDYALLVLLDDQYGLQEIWKTDASTVQQLQDRVNNKRAGIHLSDLMNKKYGSQRVYPREEGAGRGKHKTVPGPSLPGGRELEGEGI